MSAIEPYTDPPIDPQAEQLADWIIDTSIGLQDLRKSIRAHLWRPASKIARRISQSCYLIESPADDVIGGMCDWICEYMKFVTGSHPDVVECLMPPIEAMENVLEILERR